METRDKSLPRATRVLKACGALGRYLHDEFSEHEKAEFAALLGVQRKAAMQYLRDTRAEFAETLKDAERVLADPRLKPADRVQLLREAGQMIDQLNPEPHSSEGGETSGGDISTDIYDKRAEIHTTACTVHPTHTATRCEACVKEAEVRVRTETAAQYEAHFRAREENEAAEWVALKQNHEALRAAHDKCINDRNYHAEAARLLREYHECVVEHLENAGIPGQPFDDLRVAKLIDQRDECNTAHENLMRENAELLDQARPSDLSEIVAALGLEPNVHERDILECIALLRESAQERDGLIEQLRDAEARDSMPSVRAVTLEGEAQLLPAWYKPGMFAQQSPASMDEEDYNLAITLLRDSGNGLLTMRERAAVLQLAADMAALAAAR